MDFFSRCKKSIWSPPLMRYWHKNCNFSPFSVCGGWRTTFDRLRVYSTLGESQGSGQIHTHARDADYSVLLSFPLSFEYRACVCVVLRISRVGVCCPPSILHGCVLSSVYRAWVCFVLVARVGVCCRETREWANTRARARRGLLGTSLFSLVLRVSCVRVCCPPSIARGCVLSCEYRAWVYVVLRVSRVRASAFCPLSCLSP